MSIMDASPVYRIYWDGRYGATTGVNGHKVLDNKPDLGFRYCEVDYMPGVCCQIRRETWHQVDDMRAEEAEACARYLHNVRL